MKTTTVANAHLAHRAGLRGRGFTAQKRMARRSMRRALKAELKGVRLGHQPFGFC